MTGGQTIGAYDNVANVLSAFRYLSGPAWTSYGADTWATIYTAINNKTNFSNTAIPT